MPYTEFHYTPTGTGVISGKEVLEQTEDAINDLGGQISGDVQTAIDTANNALNTANTASADAQNAVNTANTAYTAATNAQNTANTAQNTASNALTAAQNAQNDVNALGNRVTTAENNISQNTSDISGLTTRMGTAEGNITTLQNDVITAQGTATSAQNTATLAREQAYVTRYTNTAVSDNSTVAYAVITNTDNIKANDLLLDINGKLYQISSVDTVNQTVSVTTPLTQLAVDSDVVHKSGDETVSGVKTFSSSMRLTSYPSIRMYSSDDEWNVQPTTVKQSEIRFTDKNSITVSYFAFQHRTDSIEPFRTCWRQHKMDGTQGFYGIVFNNLGNFYPENNNAIDLGGQGNRWKSVYATNYYYGPNNVEFSTKFVTTDTNQTISGNKTFSSINGVEPSSLSLPSGNASDIIDISSYLSVLDGSNANTYVAPANGWISITLSNSSGIQAYINGLWGNQLVRPSGGAVRFLMPVLKNLTVNILIFGGAVDNARFIPCQGNV